MSEPTKGLRVRVENFTVGHGQSDNMLGMNTPSGYTSDEQAAVNATYINWLIETDERRREQAAKRAVSQDDLMVDLGNLGGSEKKFTAMMRELDTVRNEAYEDMVEDFINTFNNVVLQGIDPLVAIYALSQALAIVLGFALRANLPFAIAQAILTQQMKSATASEKMVRVITAPAGRG
jgi:hypothetical protein